jgi:hypothetical protein
MYETSFMPGEASTGPLQMTAVNYMGLAVEPQRIEFDGAGTLTFWHTPASGCGDLIGLQLSLSGQYLGIVNYQPCGGES